MEMHAYDWATMHRSAFEKEIYSHGRVDETAKGAAFTMRNPHALVGPRQDARKSLMQGNFKVGRTGAFLQISPHPQLPLPVLQPPKWPGTSGQ